MDYRKEFVVEPGTKVRLSKIDPSYKGKYETHEKAAGEIGKHLERLNTLQYLLYADGDQSLLVVLQALDAAGKDGVVRHGLAGMNPQGPSVLGFRCSRARKKLPMISCGAPTSIRRAGARW